MEFQASGKIRRDEAQKSKGTEGQGKPKQTTRNEGTRRDKKEIPKRREMKTTGGIIVCAAVMILAVEGFRTGKGIKGYRRA